MFYATKIVVTPMGLDDIESDVMKAQREITSAIHFHTIEEKMKLVLADVQNGKFANDFVSEIKAGSPEFNRLRKEGSEHLIESTGKKLRSMMSWMDGDKLVGDK